MYTVNKLIKDVLHRYGYNVVEAVRGDDLAKAYGPFSVLKVDVEGFEEMVLRGCGEILAGRPKLALELHLGMLENYGSKAETILEMIGAEGYEGVYSIWPDPKRFYPFEAGKLPDVPLINLFLRARGGGEKLIVDS